jgi:hypothetical protein
MRIETRNKITDFLFGYTVDGVASISTVSYGIPKWQVFKNRRIDKALQEQELEYLKSEEYAQQCVRNYFSRLADKRLRDNKGRFIKRG